MAPGCLSSARTRGARFAGSALARTKTVSIRDKEIIMRGICAALATSGFFASSVALSATTPLIVEESAKLVLPNSQYNTISDVAVDGDTAVVGVTRYEQQTGEHWNTAYVYERAAN